MRLVVDISEYDNEWIKNAYEIPQEINTKIADAIINAEPLKPEPQWIPWNTGNLPKESGTYTVTMYDGVARRVTYAKYQKRLKRWELTGARAYWRVLAWMPLPEPWKGDAE
jgi:hypothetical protein